MGQLSWHTRLATHHRSHLLDGDQMEAGYALKWRLDVSEAYSRMLRRLKPNPNFFKTYGLKTKSEPKESEQRSRVHIAVETTFDTPVKSHKKHTNNNNSAVTLNVWRP